MLAVRDRFREAEPPAGTETLSLPEAGVFAGSEPNWYVSQEGAPSMARFTEGLLPPTETILTDTDAEFSPVSVVTVTDWGETPRVKVSPVPRIWKSLSSKSPVLATIALIR